MKSADYAAWCAAIFTAIMALMTVLALVRDSTERKTIEINRRRDISSTVVNEGGVMELQISNQTGQVIRNWKVELSGGLTFSQSQYGSLTPGLRKIKLTRLEDVKMAEFELSYWERTHKFSRNRVAMLERLTERKSHGYLPEVAQVAEV